MSNMLEEYFSALERLRANKPIRIPKGTRITNDAVALEAGRGKGSIKKSRPVFVDLIKAIEDAGVVQAEAHNSERGKLDKAKLSSTHYREQLDAALAREVSLLYEVYGLKKQLAALSGGTVVPIRPTNSTNGEDGQKP